MIDYEKSNWLIGVFHDLSVVTGECIIVATQGENDERTQAAPQPPQSTEEITNSGQRGAGGECES